MTAPCPTFGFCVVLEPRSDLSSDDRTALSAAWMAFLERRGLYCERRGGAPRMEYVVLGEGTQATDADRLAVRAWLAARTELMGWSTGDLEDLKETR